MFEIISLFYTDPLELVQYVVFLIKGLAMVGLFAGVPVMLDWVVADFSGEHIVPLILAAVTWVNLRYFRAYKGTHRMPTIMDRAKARAQREIDAVYDEAWFHNLVVDTKAVSWNWL